MRRPGFGFLLLVFCLGLAAPLQAASVVFLNPGKSGEEFWLSVSRFMQAAAVDLGHELEIIYAERDAARMVANAKAVAGRNKKPDYLIAVNEKQVAPEILRLTAGTGIKVFLLLNSITPEQKRDLEKAGALGHLVGSLVPNNEEAGYQMALALAAEARRLALPMSAGAYPLIAIGGDKATPASIEREAGLRRALAERPELRLTQIVYGEWNQQRAREQMDILLARYPEARLVWAANDLMAFGAIQAAEARGIAPGRTMLFSGLNNSAQAMQARLDGRLSVLAAGHFTAGGWALVMLHDLQAGRNLDQAGGRDRQDSLFALIDEQQARRFLERFGDRGGVPLNFRQFSLAHNPRIKEYRFSLLPLLQ